MKDISKSWLRTNELILEIKIMVAGLTTRHCGDCGKQQYVAVVIDMAISTNTNIGNSGKKEQQNIKKYQCMQEDLKNRCRGEATVVIRALGAVTTKMGEQLQHISGTTSEMCPEKCNPMGSQVHRNLSASSHWQRNQYSVIYILIRFYTGNKTLKYFYPGLYRYQEVLQMPWEAQFALHSHIDGTVSNE